jgi:hypothetical protein
VLHDAVVAYGLADSLSPSGLVSQSVQATVPVGVPEPPTPVEIIKDRLRAVFDGFTTIYEDSKRFNLSREGGVSQLMMAARNHLCFAGLERAIIKSETLQNN